MPKLGCPRNKSQMFEQGKLSQLDMKSFEPDWYHAEHFGPNHHVEPDGFELTEVVLKVLNSENPIFVFYYKIFISFKAEIGIAFRHEILRHESYRMMKMSVANGIIYFDRYRAEK